MPISWRKGFGEIRSTGLSLDEAQEDRTGEACRADKNTPLYRASSTTPGAGAENPGCEAGNHWIRGGRQRGPGEVQPSQQMGRGPRV